MRLRSRQRHPVQGAVDHCDKGWGSVPEVPLQPTHPTGQREPGREPVSLLQARRSLPKKTPWTQKAPDKPLENGTPRQAWCMSSKQAIVLPSANHPLGAAGHPAPSLPSTQGFITSMSSPAPQLHPQGVPGSGHRATATSSTRQAAEILAFY